METRKLSTNNTEQTIVFYHHVDKLLHTGSTKYALVAEHIKQREGFPGLDRDLKWSEFLPATRALKNDKALV